MLGRLARLPFTSEKHIFELKWDGMRALAFIERSALRLQSRNVRDVTSQFPELARLPDYVGQDLTVLDGELVCMDDQGLPNFSLMQRRLQRQAKGRIARAPKVNFVAFDILYSGGISLLDEPLSNRKAILHDVLKPTDIAQPCDFIENDGEAFFRATCEMGLEGVMAKDKSSTYLPGQRSTHWLKIKRVRQSEFVVCGYTFGGNRKELFSSLILGLYGSEDELVYVGQVGSGFNDGEAKGLYPLLQESQVAGCPFRSAPVIQRFMYWCEPTLVCSVGYGEFTQSGKLRYPVYLGLRDDKSSLDCRIEDAPAWPLSPDLGRM